MKIATRVSRSSGDAQASRVERLKERLLRERADEIQIQVRRARREDAVSNATVTPGQRR